MGWGGMGSEGLFNDDDIYDQPKIDIFRELVCVILLTLLSFSYHKFDLYCFQGFVCAKLLTRVSLFVIFPISVSLRYIVDTAEFKLQCLFW